MEDFNIGAMKARNIAAQFGVIEKAETSDEEVMKARQVGDMHPNGKWVWTEYKPGRFDWRPLKGRGGVDRTPKKGDEGGSAKKEDEGGKKTNTSSKTSGADVSKFMDAIKVYSNKYTDESKVTVSKTPKGNWNVSYDGHRLGIINGNMLSDKVAKEKGWIEGSQKKAPTLDDHAKKTDTKTLENAAKSSKAPGSVKGAAEAELKERKNKEIAKKLNLHSKGELATELTRIASEWDSYDDAQKTQTKQAIAQAHSTVLKNITSGNASDEAIAALADLTSIQNFFKDSASQPKQVGDIVKDLVADLKAKNSNDTTAGKEKLEDLSKKVSGLSDGKVLTFSSNDKSIELKREKTFDDGTVQYTMYVDGIGVYTTIKADNVAKKMNELFPDAEETSSGKKYLTRSQKKNPAELETISEVEDYAKSISGVIFKNVKSAWGDKGAKAFELTYPHGGKMMVDFLPDGEYVYELTDSKGNTVISTNSTDETTRTDWSFRLNPDKIVSRRVEVLKTKLTKLKGEETKARNKMTRNYSSFSDKYAYQKASEAVSDMKTKIQELQSLIGTF